MSGDAKLDALEVPGDDRVAFVAASRWGVDEVLAVYGRVLGGLERVQASADCCFAEDLRAECDAAVSAARKATLDLAGLPVDEATDLESALRLVRQGLAICNDVTDALLVDERRWEESAVNRFVDPGVRLADSALPLVFADVLLPPGVAPPEIPPDQVAEWLRQLHRVLSDFVNGITNTNGTPERAAALARARELLETLRRYIAAVLGGGAMTLRELVAFLRPFLREILSVLRPLVGANEWKALGQAIIRVITPMAEYLGASAGGVPLLWAILACIAAAGLGMLVGWLIGNVKIGDQTIHEHLADFFYWLFWAPAAACEKLWEAYLKAKERRRQYQNSGSTLDKSVMIPLLAEETAILSAYVDKCAKGQGPIEAELRRLEAELQLLTK
jgi:hypothetical protein